MIGRDVIGNDQMLMRKGDSALATPYLRQWLILTIAVAVTCCGCRQPKSDRDSERHSETGLQFVDDLDRTVTLPAEVVRIVSLSPAVTETLFAIGAGDRVVGVTKFADFPAQVKKIPQVGGFVTESLSVERIVKLEPDLVISAGSLQVGVIEQLEGVGIPTIALEPNSVHEIDQMIRRLGRAVSAEAGADALADAMAVRFEQLRKRLEGCERPRVYYEVANQPLMTAGGNSFIGELVTRAGGENVFDDLDSPYPTINSEEVVRRDPEIILVPDRKDARRTIVTRDGWQTIDAVQQDRVYVIDEDIVSRAGPRVVDGLESIARAIHPQRFADPDDATAAP